MADYEWHSLLAILKQGEVGDTSHAQPGGKIDFTRRPTIP